MNRLYSMAVPLIIAASGSIPTLPMLFPTAPSTTGIVATDAGIVYFVDSFHRTVWRFQPGEGLSAFVAGRNGRTLDIDENGNIYGTHQEEPGRATFWRADGDGKIVDLKQSDLPDAFVIDNNSVIDNGKRDGVRVLRTAGQERLLLPGAEMGVPDGSGEQTRFIRVGGTTLTDDGELLVTSGHTIRRIAANGAVTVIAEREKLLRPRSTLISWLLGEGRSHLTGIAMGAHGEIYVANTARDAVIRINRDGNADRVFSSDDGWTPTGVATAHGCLYILEYGQGVRIRRIDKQGRGVVLAVVHSDRSFASLMSSRFATS